MAQIKIQKWDEVNGVATQDEEPLPGYDSGKNYLRSVEDNVEQNDNSLDGIINNVDRTAEENTKRSVLQRLTEQEPQEEELVEVYRRQGERVVKSWEKETETLF